MAENAPLYMGFDLSTQQLKSIVVDSGLKLIHEAKVDFDADLSNYGIQKGVLANPDEGEVFAPVAMWLDAVDLVLNRLRDAGLNFSQVKGLSGAGMQHGTVFWSHSAAEILQNLDPSKKLAEQMQPGDQSGKKSAFAHAMSPNWQDASTQEQCDAFDAALETQEKLAEVTGSKAHHRFSGPQILRYRSKYPDHYEQTSRISLVSSFLASVFLGKIASIDVGDVGGMNLFDLNKERWDERLLALAAGGSDKVDALKKRLGDVAMDAGKSFGSISNYFSKRFGFPADCQVIPFTGDNPATILSLPLRKADAMVSLGTSTTFLMSTSEFRPDPAYHFMLHPCEPGLYMFMLCYKNGGLAREQIRDKLNGDSKSGSWDKFNQTALSTPPVSQHKDTDPMRLGLYFPRHEIVPNLRAGQWRYAYDPSKSHLEPLKNDMIKDDARNIVESQMLSLRLRSQNLVHPATIEGKKLPPQPRRVYLVGGGSVNEAIAQISGEVLGSFEGVYKLDIGGNACGLGAAYKAVWGCERKNSKETFTDLISERWDEKAFVDRIADGYKEGVFEKYGEAMKGFEKMEKAVLADEEGTLMKTQTGGVFMPADS